MSAPDRVRLDSVERAVADIAAGRAVVVVDDEDRENEGDIIFAAEKATPTRQRARAEEPGVVESVVRSSAFKSMLRSAGTVLGREITRSVFGTSRRR